MNVIQEAVEYTKEKWNTLTLPKKVNNFYIRAKARCDDTILQCKENLLKYLQEGDLERALDSYDLMMKWKNRKVNLEEFIKYIE